MVKHKSKNVIGIKKIYMNEEIGDIFPFSEEVRR